MKYIFLALAALTLTLLPALAQEPPATPPTRTETKKPSNRSKVETITVRIVKVEVEKRSLTLKAEGSGRELLARADDVTEFFKEGKPAKLSDFNEGDKVTARISLKPNATAGTLKSLFDEKTVAANKIQRTQEVVGKVVVSTLTNIDVKLEDGTVKSYRVNDRTQFFKADRPAKATDFKEGDPVAIRPRGLPSGTVQAVVVADKKEAIEVAHTDGLSTWAGVIEKFAGADGLTLKRPDGAVRTVNLTETVAITRGKTALTKEDLKPGAKVKLHLVKGKADDKGRRTADKIAVSAR
jgi:Cu/Ag efflux protein CusF